MTALQAPIKISLPLVLAGAAVLLTATASRGDEPIIDNDRVTIRRSSVSLPPEQHDYVAISLSKRVSAIFGKKGHSPLADGAPLLVIELKDHPVTSIANMSGFPAAFPRRGARKLLENERVIVWSYRWTLGKPTPMHFHDKDAVVVFLDEGELQSTTPDGKSVVSGNKRGDVRFSPRERIHTEVLLSGAESALIAELK